MDSGRVSMSQEWSRVVSVLSVLQSWRSWLHPWDRCHTASLSSHWFCFSVCTIFGHCKIYFCQHLYFISYKWADAHCWFCTWYLCLLVSIWVEVHRFILECNKISIFVFRTYFWTKKYFTIDELMIVNCQALVPIPVPKDLVPFIKAKQSQNQRVNWDWGWQ